MKPVIINACCQSTSRFAPRPLLADAQPTPPLLGWAAVPWAALRQPALRAPPVQGAARRGDLDVTLTWVHGSSISEFAFNVFNGNTICEY